MKALVKKVAGAVLQSAFSVCKIKENKIMFETCTGEIKDHPKAFYDYVKNHNINDFEFKWAVTKGRNTQGIESSEIVYKRTLGYYYHLMTSKYWMRTHSVDNIVKKREGQIYIQLWHGPGATKKEGYDIKGRLVNTGETMPHAREWDYYIATDWPSKEYIKTALNLTIPRLLLGSCRSDVLVNMDKNLMPVLKERLGIKPGEITILYAPTFRENDFHLDKIELPIKKLCQMENVRVILRVHPEVKNRMDITEYGASVIDGNCFSDIYELYMASDIMITDYSSVSIEYSLLRRPILYYMYDLEEYIKERDFYFDYLEHLSGPIIKTEDELINAVENIDEVQQQYAEQYEEYFKRYNEKNDGHVCERFYQLLKMGFFENPGNEELPLFKEET